MKRVFVTGGSGFIGTHLVNALLKSGFEVFNFDINRPQKKSHEGNWISGDILSKSSLNSAIKEAIPDTVVHLAAKADFGDDSLSGYNSIYDGLTNLLGAIDQVSCVNRLINTSTQLVIGPGKSPNSETDFSPYMAYGEAKAIAEKKLLDRNPSYTWMIVRPTNIWGPMHPFFATSIWYYLKKRYYLNPSTEHPVMRCYGYIGNTVDQFISLINAPSESVHGRIFYLGDEIMDSSRWLDEFALQLTNNTTRKAPYFVLKSLAIIGDLAKIAKFTIPMDSERLMRMTTSYEVPLSSTFSITGAPKINLSEGVKETVKWLKTYCPIIYNSDSSTR